MNKYIFLVIVIILLCSCGRQRSGEVMTIGMDEVTEMLKETGEAIDESLATIEESQLSISDRYQLTAKAAALLRQQNNAYAFLCDGELSQAIAEAESLRVGAARLAERVELCCARGLDNSSSGGKTTKDYPSKNTADEKTHSKAKSSKYEPRPRLVSSTNEPFHDNNWSWKITGKSIGTNWSQSEISIPSRAPITITVYNNGVETPVVWTWSATISVQENNMGMATESSSITISRNPSGAGVVTFYPKGHPEQKYSIKIKSEKALREL